MLLTLLPVITLLPSITFAIIWQGGSKCCRIDRDRCLQQHYDGCARLVDDTIVPVKSTADTACKDQCIISYTGYAARFAYIGTVKGKPTCICTPFDAKEAKSQC
ncbi:hypothetical protein FKW77_000541 [Venturia effusa]|uniref:Uncharacterized protein n=1 Tax=Venturia effusa TaxID=50376 RepID=A0A517L0P1_9PEZI|nr:hypothetical protein FKW77_000541 [Venturia effusa]